MYEEIYGKQISYRVPVASRRVVRVLLFFRAACPERAAKGRCPLFSVKGGGFSGPERLAVAGLGVSCRVPAAYFRLEPTLGPNGSSQRLGDVLVPNAKYRKPLRLLQLLRPGFWQPKPGIGIKLLSFCDS